MSTVWNAETLVGAWLGSCRLERPLGVGGMGAVYLARQERPHRQVAVKVLRPEVGAGPRERALFLARFRREADATAGLDHANIVPIYEFGEQDGIAYLVMPYLGSGSLADLLERRGPLPLERAFSYVAQAAAALDYAHAHGIIHRDVKPSNLLLHPDGRLLLADFGIARPLDRADLPPTGTEGQDDDTPTLTRGGLVMGTPEYMAPEQIEGASVGPAADVYALGTLAYTLLAGHPPFKGDMGDVLRRQLSEPPPLLRLLRPDVPPQVETAITRALAKRPEDRPRSAGSFARLLLGASQASAGVRTSSSGLQPVATRRLTPLPAGEGGHDAPTIHDGAWAGPVPPSASSGLAAGGPPFWPGGEAGGRPGPEEPRHISRTALAVAAAAVLLLLVGVLASQALFFQPTDRGQGLGTGTQAATTVTAMATTTPTPNPTPVANWLRLSTDSVSLTCHGGGRSAKVTLKNLGSETTDWQESGGDQLIGGISVQPNQGRLDAGQSVDVTITNNSFSFTGQNGTLYFTPTADGAGDPAALNYTAKACGTGG
jgi:Protein kinase domain